MDREALIARLRERALNAREYWENYPERGGSMDDLRDADLEVAAEQEQAASRIESLSAVIARVEGLRLTSTLREYANTECPAWPHANEIDPEDRVEDCEHCEIHHAIADKIEDQLRAALAERGADDKHE